MKKILILIFILFSTNVYSNDIKDPFYKDLKNEVLKRHSLSSASPYTVLSGVELDVLSFMILYEEKPRNSKVDHLM